MSAANTLFAASTAGGTFTFNANECDEITICTNTNALGNTETVLVSVVNSANGTTPFYFSYKNSPIAITSTPTQAQLTGATGATIFSLTLPGGVIYSFTKTATASAVGVDVLTKPRIGGGASVVRQYLAERLIDEMHLAVRPVLLGRGEPLWQGLDLDALGYACDEPVAGERATHVTVRRKL